MTPLKIDYVEQCVRENYDRNLWAAAALMEYIEFIRTDLVFDDTVYIIKFSKDNFGSYFKVVHKSKAYHCYTKKKYYWSEICEKYMYVGLRITQISSIVIL